MHRKFLTNDNVQSRSDRIIHPHSGKTDTVGRTCGSEFTKDSIWAIKIKPELL